MTTLHERIEERFLRLEADEAPVETHEYSWEGGGPNPEVNVPLLRKAVEWAEVENTLPNGMWNQRFWAQQTDCGTAYCIAGFVAQETSGGIDFFKGVKIASQCLDPDSNSLVSINTFAREHLGLTIAESDALFAASNTIEDVRDVFEWIIERT